MDTFTELKQLVDDLTELGDTATAALVRQAIDRFQAWKFEAGEGLLERALVERQRLEANDVVTNDVGRYFASCALAVA